MAGKMSMAEKLSNRVQPLKEESVPASITVGESEPPAAREVRPEPAERTPAGTPPTKSKRQSPAQVRKRSKPAEPVASEGPLSTAVQLIVELPEDVNKRLLAYKEKTRKSHTFILLRAVEMTYERLPELIREALGEEVEPAPIQLFERSARTSTPTRSDSDEPTVQHTIRTTLRNRESLTNLAEELGAPSRNFLLVTAYDAFLPKA